MKYIDSIIKPLKIKQQKAWIVSESLQTATYIILAGLMLALVLYWLGGLQ